MNLLLITVDSFRFDRTSLSGYQHDTTPFLAEFADDSYQFNRAYATGRNTAESFPGIHCSTYQSHFEGIGLPAAPPPPTLAEELGAAGYATHGINTNELLSREYNYDRGYNTYLDSRSGDEGETSRLRSTLRDLLGEGYLFELVKQFHFFTTERFGVKVFNTADAVSGFTDQLTEWSRSAADNWFIWSHYMNPHHPYNPPPECQRALGFQPISERESTKLSRKMRLRPEEVTTDEVETINQLYDAAVYSFDRELKELIETLESADLLDDTLIAITADHGELLGETERFGHPPLLREALLHVPLLFRGPVPSGIDNSLVSLLDLAPSLLSLLDCSPPPEFEGQSLFEAAGSPIDIGREFAFAETVGDELVVGCIGEEAMVTYHTERDEWRCQGLSAGEPRPAAAEPEEPYQSQMAAIERHLEKTSTTREGAEVDEDRLHSDLEALGYLDP